MPDIITISCPECKKPLKLRDDLVGKKVRCKECEAVFTVPAPKKAAAPPKAAVGAKAAPAKAPPPKGPAPAPAKAAGKPKVHEDYDNPNPYGVTTMDLTPRCPHCATEFESKDIVVCVGCGYNLETREHLKTVVTYETTGGQQFLWLLPGILAVFTLLAFIGLIVFWTVLLPDMLGTQGNWYWLTHGGVTTWIVIFSLFGIFIAGRYAIKRLILNPRPPERRKGA
jgi:hypothetical protein